MSKTNIEITEREINIFTVTERGFNKPLRNDGTDKKSVRKWIFKQYDWWSCFSGYV